jgi:hypothetical protein
MVSNPEGMTLLDIENRFDRIEAQFKQEKAQFKQEVEHFKAQLQEERRSNIESKERWHDIRKTTLDEWSRQSRTYASEKLERNDSVHGGSLMSDIEVISSFPLNSNTNCERVARWKRAFKHSYGLSYDDLRQGINDIPDKVLLAFNRRASAKRLTFWEVHENSIKSNADTIIEEWHRNPNDPDLFKEGSRAQISFIKIEEEWIQMLLPPSDQQSGDQ